MNTRRHILKERLLRQKEEVEVLRECERVVMLGNGKHSSVRIYIGWFKLTKNRKNIKKEIERG